jgi:hypothetical protein
MGLCQILNWRDEGTVSSEWIDLGCALDMVSELGYGTFALTCATSDGNAILL